MTTRVAPRSIALLCAAALAAPAAAQGVRGDGTHWGGLGDPRRARAHELLQKALSLEREARRHLPTDYHSLCERALSMDKGGESLAQVRGRARAMRALARPALRRRALLEGALIHLQAARALLPDDGEIEHAVGRVLVAWEEPGPSFSCETTRRDAEAADALRALRAKHPELSPSVVLFELAVTLTRQRDFARARQSYAEAMDLSTDREESATLRTNLAEMTMLAGDLPGAVNHYERALAMSPSGRQYLLALWGLAVALDRLGEHAAAMRHVEKALHAEGFEMNVLRSEGVFFEPGHELDYYEALGHESLAAHEGNDAVAELARAATAYRTFLRADGGRTTASTTAEVGLTRVLTALGEARKRAATSRR